nr:MAG TPA: hypothetical protein [Caudoviricetes sp.]
MVYFLYSRKSQIYTIKVNLMRKSFLIYIY